MALWTYQPRYVNASGLWLVPQPGTTKPRPMHKLRVATLTGQSFELQLETLDIPVQELLVLVQLNTGASLDGTQLFYKGVQLERDKLLSAYKVQQPWNCIFAAVRLTGG